MQNKFKKIYFFGPIILFAVSLAVFAFLYIGTKGNLNKIAELEETLQEEISKRNEVETLNDYFLSIQEEKISLESHFVQTSDVVPFLNTLESLADNVGAKTEVKSINVAKDNTGLIVDLKNTGTFSQIYKFITLLENAPYELEFISVELANAPTKEDLENNRNSERWEVLIKAKLISFAEN